MTTEPQYEVLTRHGETWVIEWERLPRELARAEARRLGGFCQPAPQAVADVPPVACEPILNDVETIPQTMYAFACGRE